MPMLNSLKFLCLNSLIFLSYLGLMRRMKDANGAKMSLVGKYVSIKSYG